MNCKLCNEEFDNKIYSYCPSCDTIDTRENISKNKNKPLKFGNYTKGVEIGKGGMGTIYKGTHNKTGEVVALKYIDNDKFLDKASGMLENEINHFQEVPKHKNTVGLKDFIHTQEEVYIVYEFIDGPDLKKYRKTSNLDNIYFKNILLICINIIDSIEHIHNHNLIHRDIKPANIILKNRNIPILIDFGLSVFENTDKNASGTPAFMSPEQKQGDTCKESDIYSFGKTLYYMITGKTNISDENSNVHEFENKDILKQILELVKFITKDDKEKRLTNYDSIKTQLENISNKFNLKETEYNEEDTLSNIYINNNLDNKINNFSKNDKDDKISEDIDPQIFEDNEELIDIEEAIENCFKQKDVLKQIEQLNIIYKKYDDKKFKSNFEFSNKKLVENLQESLTNNIINEIRIKQKYANALLLSAIEILGKDNSTYIKATQIYHNTIEADFETIKRELIEYLKDEDITNTIKKIKELPCEFSSAIFKWLDESVNFKYYNNLLELDKRNFNIYFGDLSLKQSLFEISQIDFFINTYNQDTNKFWNETRTRLEKKLNSFFIDITENKIEPFLRKIIEKHTTTFENEVKIIEKHIPEKFRKSYNDYITNVIINNGEKENE